jgi:hypothetical protein
MIDPIPVILFTYARPDHLQRTLNCLKADQVPLIFAFSDGPKRSEDRERVAAVRKLLHEIDWCKIIITERTDNLGLGKSILTGVSEVLRQYQKAIVFEDDLICVPGTYAYLCSGLNHFEANERVMSVTGWTHPAITPSGVTDQPYFDGRAECWVWGTWARAWKGMDTDAKTLMKQCKANNLNIYQYGEDLVEMANIELKNNIWAVRFLYLHILNRGLCLRPPWSMVEHTGFDPLATNAKDGSLLANPLLKDCPPIPTHWPKSQENPECSLLHQKAFGNHPTTLGRLYRMTRNRVAKVLRPVRSLMNKYNSFGHK